MQALDNPAQIVHAVVIKTIDEWKEKNPPEKIEKDTLKLLNKNAEEILLKLKLTKPLIKSPQPCSRTNTTRHST
jgi:hypothetical protein